MSETPLSISCLNDFVFCPVSIYFHMLDEGDRLLTQDAYQLNGSDAHKKSDLAAYSTKKSMLQGLIIISYDIVNDKKRAKFRQSNQVTIVFSSKQRCHRLCCPPLAIRQYSSVGRRAAEERCLPKIFDLKREDFSVLEVEERRHTLCISSDETNKTGKYSVSETVVP